MPARLDLDDRMDQLARYLIDSRVMIRPLHGRCALVLLSRTHNGACHEQTKQSRPFSDRHRIDPTSGLSSPPTVPYPVNSPELPRHIGANRARETRSRPVVRAAYDRNPSWPIGAGECLASPARCPQARGSPTPAPARASLQSKLASPSAIRGVRVP